MVTLIGVVLHTVQHERSRARMALHREFELTIEYNWR